MRRRGLDWLRRAPGIDDFGARMAPPTPLIALASSFGR